MIVLSLVDCHSFFLFVILHSVAYCSAECHSAECCCAKCHFAKYHSDVCLSAVAILIGGIMPYVSVDCYTECRSV